MKRALFPRKTHRTYVMNAEQMFEMTEEGFVADVAPEVGLAAYPTGGRALVSLPLISHSAMDIFAGNEVHTYTVH